MSIDRGNNTALHNMINYYRTIETNNHEELTKYLLLGLQRGLPQITPVFGFR